MKHVRISSPVLTTFKYQNHTSKSSGYSIMICGPKVEKLILSGSFPDNIHLSESTVRYAAFSTNTYNSDPRSDLLVRKLLRQVSSVTYLDISACVYKMIAQTRRKLPLPRYDTLQRLVISVTCSAKLLLEFLHLAPRIKFLELRDDTQITPVEFDCGELDSVPDGLISHLEEVNFKPMSMGLLFHLAKFLLKNAVELKKVHICHYNKRGDQIAKRLSTFTKASLNVEFVYKMNQN